MVLPSFVGLMFMAAVFFGPSFAMTQALATLRMRSVATSLLLFIQTLIGNGLGPSVTGLHQRSARAVVPAETRSATRWSSSASSTSGPRCITCSAARTLRQDLEATESARGAVTVRSVERIETLTLTDDEKAMLDGRDGKAQQKAMELLVRYAEALGAERFVDTQNVAGVPGSANPFLQNYYKDKGADGLDAIFSHFDLDSDELVEVPHAAGADLSPAGRRRSAALADARREGRGVPELPGARSVRRAARRRAS